MATIRKTITVTDQQNEWIKARIASGDFTNDSEYIRDLIRRDQARQAEIEAIRAELIKGEQSGEPRPMREELLRKIRKQPEVELSESPAEILRKERASR